MLKIVQRTQSSIKSKLQGRTFHDSRFAPFPPSASKERGTQVLPMPPKSKPKTSQNRVTKSTREKNKKPRKSLASSSSSSAAAAAAAKIMSELAPEGKLNTDNMTNATASALDEKTNQPVYFWRPNDGNGYLGQWYWSEFTVDGDTYATAEMWMMVQKAKLFEDEAIAAKMLATTDPKSHKALGRKVRNFNEATWNEHKLAIVTEGNYHKFTKSEDAVNLRGLLLATRDRELVEASPLDRIWGVGFAEKNAGANRHRWGQNLLGKALMSVRERLRAEEGEGGGESA